MPIHNPGRRKFLKQAGIFLFVSGFFPACASFSGDRLTLIHISDSHTGAPERNDSLRFVLDDIAKNRTSPFLLVHTGDVSEHGWDEELKDYERIINSFPEFHVEIMGNHDSRWSRSGRLSFNKRVGERHFLYDSKLCSVIGVDSSILLEQYGYIDARELLRLEKILQTRGDKPAILCMHHPPGWEGRFIGSEFPLFSLTGKYNVPLILAGHVHQYREIKINGTSVITSGATMSPESGYLIHEISAKGIRVSLRNPVKEETTVKAEIPIEKKSRVESFPPLSDDLKVTSNADSLRLASERIPRPGTVYRIDGKPIEFNNGSMDIGKVSPGEHELAEIFEVEKDHQIKRWANFRIPDSKGILKWSSGLSAGIQSKPAFFRDMLIVGANDGRLYWIDRTSGKVIRTRKLSECELLSSPVIAGDKIYIGTIEGYLICLKAGDGREIWRKLLDASVIATTLVFNDFAVVGTGTGSLFCLRMNSGEVVYQFKAGNLIKCTPAFDGESLLFGAWDGYFYKIDAFSGRPVWSKRINSPHYSPATSNPVVFENKVIFVSHDYRIHCLYREDGKWAWSFPSLEEEFKWNSPIISRCKASYSSAVFFGRRAYFTSITGHIVGFNIDSGIQEAEIPLPEPVFDSFPLLMNDKILVAGTIGGKVLFANLHTDKIVYTYSTGYTYIFAPPASQDDEIVIGNLGGKLFFFSLESVRSFGT